MLRDDVFVEVRAYLEVLRRRWPLVVLPTLVALVFSVVTFARPQSFYTVGVRYIVGQEPSVSAETDEESRFYTWLTSQYVVNSLTDWVNGTDFARRVSEELAAQGVLIDTKTIHDNSEALTIRSRLTLLIDHANEAELEQIVNAATLVLNRDNQIALPQLGEESADVRPMDDVLINEIPPSITAYLPIPIRIFMAFAAGIGLALLIEYVDPKVHSRRHVEALDLPIIAAIPRE